MSIVFGPVPSRRLGWSLGIDVLPPNEKLCTLDCVYCQVGHTRVKTIKRGLPLPSTDINRAIDEALPKSDIDVVTFSGSGEPTLHQHLGQFIERVKSRCATPVAVITNATLIDKPDVRHDLALADIVVPSLDAATQAVFETVNRPHASLRVERIIEGLIAFRDEFAGKLLLEIMFVKGLNDGPGELVALKTAADRIRPDQIHINTVTRPPAEGFAKALTQEELDRIAEMFGPRATTVGAPPLPGRNPDAAGVEARIVDLASRRGVTVEDIAGSLGLDRVSTLKFVDKLVGEKKIKKLVHGEISYYTQYY